MTHDFNLSNKIWIPSIRNCGFFSPESSKSSKNRANDGEASKLEDLLLTKGIIDGHEHRITGLDSKN